MMMILINNGNGSDGLNAKYGSGDGDGSMY